MNAKPSTDSKPRESNVERALSDIRATGVSVKPFGAWEQTFGWAKDDPLYDEAMRLGAEWRAEVNRKSLEDKVLQDAHS